MDITELMNQAEGIYRRGATEVIDLADRMSAAVGVDPLKQPDYKILLDGKDITGRFAGRLKSLRLTDQRGFESDELQICLNDSDGLLEIPPRGAKLRVAIGWKGEPLVDKGEYTVDEVSGEGAPDTMSISAKATDLRAGISSKRERSWHRTTVGKIVESIARANGLIPCCSAWLAKRKIDHIDQTSESDANLLTRLAEQHDAIATVKNGRLLFVKSGDSESVSGIAFRVMRIVRECGDRHHWSIADRNAYTAVKAYWHDLDSAHKGEVIVDANTKFERRHGVTKRGKRRKRSHLTAVQVKAIEPSAQNYKVLRHIYATEHTALQAAKAAWEKIQRGMAEFGIVLARGVPELISEQPVIVQGFKRALDSCGWLIDKVEHSIEDGGYTCKIDLEMKLEDVQG